MATDSILLQDNRAHATTGKVNGGAPPFPGETIGLQLWSYDPMLTSTDGRTADPFSLWRSLKDVDDPCVSESLEEMMGKISWS